MESHVYTLGFATTRGRRSELIDALKGMEPNVKFLSLTRHTVTIGTDKSKDEIKAKLPEGAYVERPVKEGRLAMSRASMAGK